MLAFSQQAGTKNGERIFVEGVEEMEPLSNKQIKKQKALEKVLAKLATGSDTTTGDKKILIRWQTCVECFGQLICNLVFAFFMD